MSCLSTLVRGLFALSLGLIAASALPERAHAGAQTDDVVCSTSSSGSGYCHGNLRGFARHADARTSAQLISVYLSGSDPLFLFWARVGSQTFSCAPTGRLIEAWPSLVGFDGHFRINWNSSGQCTSLWVTNGSEYKSYAATATSSTLRLPLDEVILDR